MPEISMEGNGDKLVFECVDESKIIYVDVPKPGSDMTKIIRQSIGNQLGIDYQNVHIMSNSSFKIHDKYWEIDQNKYFYKIRNTNMILICYVQNMLPKFIEISEYSCAKDFLAIISKPSSFLYIIDLKLTSIAEYESLYKYKTTNKDMPKFIYVFDQAIANKCFNEYLIKTDENKSINIKFIPPVYTGTLRNFLASLRNTNVSNIIIKINDVECENDEIEIRKQQISFVHFEECRFINMFEKKPSKENKELLLVYRYENKMKDIIEQVYEKFGKMKFDDGEVEIFWRYLPIIKDKKIYEYKDGNFEIYRIQKYKFTSEQITKEIELEFATFTGMEGVIYKLSACLSITPDCISFKEKFKTIGELVGKEIKYLIKAKPSVVYRIKVNGKEFNDDSIKIVSYDTVFSAQKKFVERYNIPYENVEILNSDNERIVEEYKFFPFSRIFGSRNVPHINVILKKEFTCICNDMSKKPFKIEYPCTMGRFKEQFLQFYDAQRNINELDIYVGGAHLQLRNDEYMDINNNNKIYCIIKNQALKITFDLPDGTKFTEKCNQDDKVKNIVDLYASNHLLNMNDIKIFGFLTNENYKHEIQFDWPAIIIFTPYSNISMDLTVWPIQIEILGNVYHININPTCTINALKNYIKDRFAPLDNQDIDIYSGKCLIPPNSKIIDSKIVFEKSLLAKISENSIQNIRILYTFLSKIDGKDNQILIRFSKEPTISNIKELFATKITNNTRGKLILTFRNKELQDNNKNLCDCVLIKSEDPIIIEYVEYTREELSGMVINCSFLVNGETKYSQFTKIDTIKTAKEKISPNNLDIDIISANDENILSDDELLRPDFLYQIVKKQRPYLFIDKKRIKRYIFDLSPSLKISTVKQIVEKRMNAEDSFATTLLYIESYLDNDKTLDDYFINPKQYYPIQVFFNTVDIIADGPIMYDQEKRFHIKVDEAFIKVKEIISRNFCGVSSNDIKAMLNKQELDGNAIIMSLGLKSTAIIKFEFMPINYKFRTKEQVFELPLLPLSSINDVRSEIAKSLDKQIESVIIPNTHEGNTINNIFDTRAKDGILDISIIDISSGKTVYHFRNTNKDNEIFTESFYSGIYIDDVRIRISEILSEQVSNENDISLIFAGKTMRNDFTLKDYNIPPNSVISVFIAINETLDLRTVEIPGFNSFNDESSDE